MLCATKVRIDPTPEQAAFLGRQFGAVRFVSNKALAVKRHRHKVHGQKLSAKHDLKKLLPVAKKSRRYSWLADYDAMALQQACINLDKAFTNFFEGRARYPQFKRKHGQQSSSHCSGRIAVLEDSILLPKMDRPIRAMIHRPVSGTLKSITVTRTPTGKHFAALLFEDGQEKPGPIRTIAKDTVVGVDVGLIDLAVESNGRRTANPRFLKRALCNLRRRQRALARKKKGSRNRAKARLKVAAAHERLANARHDFQHKLSKRLTDENQAVAVETLAVKTMLKNHKLSQAIADAAWHSLILKLRYKAERAGKHLVRIDRWTASSKTCSRCGQVKEELDLGERRWACEGCGAEHDRDENAAETIRRVGILDLSAGGWHVPVCAGLRQTVHATAAAREAETLAA